MPAWVKDHDIWEQAKAHATREYPDKAGEDFYRIVTAIYKKMGGRILTAKARVWLWFKSRVLRNPEYVSSGHRGETDYGAVKFADPAHKKYPIDTAEHIRAAWNYIHHPHNAAFYSKEALAAVKARIVRAWKRKISADGPLEVHEDD